MRTFIYLVAIGVTLSGCTIEREGADAAADTSYTVDSVVVPEPGANRSRPDTSRQNANDTDRGAGTTPTPAPVTATLMPVDEADQAADIFAFRMRLIEAVGARDAEALMDMMTDNIRISFGTTNGKAGFREMWQPTRSDSELWPTLARVLGGGGIYEEGPHNLGSVEAEARFSAPYFTAAFPGRQYDAFTHGVILAANEPVHQEADGSSAVIDSLSFRIVNVPNFMPYEDEPYDWVRIALPDDRFGYVRADRVGSPIGHRTVFHKIDGEWKMTAFLAGD